MKKKQSNRGRRSEAFKSILEHFIKPITKHMNSYDTLDDVFETFFHPAERAVFSATVKESCLLPGLEEKPGGMLVKDQKERTLNPGDKLLIVLDKVDKIARVELEDQRIFQLKEYEWDYLKGRLDEFGKAGFQDSARLRY